jgi:hypothetical protein
MKKEELELILKNTDFEKYGLINYADYFLLLKNCNNISNDAILYFLTEIIDGNLNSYLSYPDAMDYLSKNDRSLIKSKELLLEQKIEIEKIESSLLASLCIKDALKKDLAKKILL